MKQSISLRFYHYQVQFLAKRLLQHSKRKISQTEFSTGTHRNETLAQLSVASIEKSDCYCCVQVHVKCVLRCVAHCNSICRRRFLAENRGSLLGFFCNASCVVSELRFCPVHVVEYVEIVGMVLGKVISSCPTAWLLFQAVRPHDDYFKLSDRMMITSSCPTA